MLTNSPAADQYNLGMQWMFGNQFINYLYSNEDPKKEVQKQRDAWLAKKKQRRY